MVEEWKQCDEDHAYSVSNLGRCYSHKTKRILTGKKNTNGYIQITMGKYPKSFLRLLSRLVAAAFVPNPFNKPIVDHINGDILDNRACNLRWVTDAESTRNHGRERSGVYYDSNANLYRAHIMTCGTGGERITRGFKKEVDAWSQRIAWENHYYGEYKRK